MLTRVVEVLIERGITRPGCKEHRVTEDANCQAGFNDIKDYIGVKCVTLIFKLHQGVQEVSLNKR